MTKFLFVVYTGIILIGVNGIASQRSERRDIGTQMPSEGFPSTRPNDSWTKKVLQDFVRERATTIKLFHCDRSDEKTVVTVKDVIVWNNELSSYADYLACAQHVYDALAYGGYF